MTKVSDIKLQLNEIIQSGHAKLPSERELSQHFSTTRITIREALKLLESEGKIYRANRRGWFPSPAKLKYDPAFHAQKSFMSLAIEQGFEPKSEVIKVYQLRCDDRLAAIMQTCEGKPLVGVDRVRYLDGRPVLLEKMLFRADLIAGIENEDFSASIHKILREKYQITFGSSEYEITASCISGEDAQALHAFEGAASLQIKRSYRFKSGEIFEYDIELWRADALRIHLQTTYE